jgi:hypothetical protein
MRRVSTVLLGVVALLAAGLIPMTQASAIPGSVAVDTAKYSSKLVITQNGKTTTVLTPRMKSPLGQGPTGAYLHCNKVYNFSDVNGTYTIQHACGGSTGPWGYRMSAALCGIIAGNVVEAGMSWTRNGVSQPRQAPHTVGCTYIFHGTYNPDRDYDHISYVDSFTFAVKGGHGSLQIYGDFTTVGNPCSPTSC